MDGDASIVQIVRSAETLALTVPVLAELRFGFAKGTTGKKNEAFLARFLDSPRVSVLACDEQTTLFYAQIKLQLSRQGTPIPINDVWIAALVVQHGLMLCSFDSDFDRLPQLSRVGPQPKDT